MKSFFDEIRRRRVVPWVAGYAAGAWVAVEVIDTLGGMWGWSAIVPRSATVLLGCGVLVAGVLAWYHGERGAQRATRTEVTLLVGIAILAVVSTTWVLRSTPAYETPDSANFTTSADEPIASIVVLPFLDTSPTEQRSFIGDGIAETLIVGLGRLEALRVVARTSAFAFKDAGLSVQEIATRLGVQAVVDGTVAQAGDRVRITANLIDGSTGLAMWQQMFDQEVAAEDLFDLQDEIARQIVSALRVELAGERRLVREATRSPEALAAYNLGQHHWVLRTREDMILAARYFQEAIDHDPDYAEAWAGLALAYALHSPREYAVPGFPAHRALLLSEEAAERALDLDPELAAGYTALADVALQRGELAQAEQHFRRAIELNRGSETAHHWLADLLMSNLQGEEALIEIRIAEAQSPLAPAILVEHAQAYMTLGRYPEAIAQIEKAIQRRPDALLVRSYASLYYIRLGQWENAADQVVAAARILNTPPEVTDRLASALREPELRQSFLRRWADGVVEDATDATGLDMQFLGRPELRFLPALELDGPEAAMDLLEEIVDGPEGDAVYAPALPALMGPDLAASQQGRRIVRSVRIPR